MNMEIEKTEDQSARFMPPEDLRPGQFVTMSHMMIEVLWPPRDESECWKRIRPLRFEFLTWGSDPLKVLEVCLPYVLVRRPNGTHELVDVRRYRLMRLERNFGRESWRRLKADHKREKAEAGGN